MQTVVDIHTGPQIHTHTHTHTLTLVHMQPYGRAELGLEKQKGVLHMRGAWGERWGMAALPGRVQWPAGRSGLDTTATVAHTAAPLAKKPTLPVPNERTRSVAARDTQIHPMGRAGGRE